MDDLDPQATPGEPGKDEGQPEPTEAQQQPEVDLTAEMKRLRDENEKLQHRLTQRGRELKKLSEVSQPQPHEPAATDFDWENPGASIGKYISKAFGEFEARQEQRRQAEEMLRRTADERGIPVPKLQEYYAKLQEASQDPYELMDTIARMYQADHADAAVSRAAKAARESVQRNARAVTAEGSSTQPMESHKPLDDMTDAELEAYVTKKYGVAEWPSG